MSKLADKAKSSKLKNSIQSTVYGSTEPRERVVRQIKPKDYPRSYRLDTESINSLKSTLDKINEISPKKISESRLIKALILLSKDTEEDKLLKALKEVW